MAGTGGTKFPTLVRGTITRNRPTFMSRTATDDAAQLLRRSSLPSFHEQRPASATGAADDNPYHPRTAESEAPPRQHELTRKLLSHLDGGAETPDSHHAGDHEGSIPQQNQSITSEVPESDTKPDRSSRPKVGSFPRPVGGTEKLGTLSGVFVPTTLNVLSILMFIRFGFILGQSGVLGMFGMLVAAYLINLLTTMSISAVASNGTVRGGGAYYLISRSLGPEFGGSIGIISYLGFVFNTGMNAVGLIDCLNYNFGAQSGNWSNFLPEGGWWQYLWSTLAVVLCVLICLAGSAIFARASNGLLLVLLIATFSIPLSALVLSPFEVTKQNTHFTGLSLQTFNENLKPHFTRGAAGSAIHGKENYQDMFGILFPATGGIFAGASMSGDLKSPSKSIPRGTLYGLALTFVSYTLVILAMAASITRQSLHRNTNVVQDTNISGILVLLGEIASTFFSVLMGIIGPAKQLQAIARDGVFPGIKVFGQGTKKGDDPVYAILLTFAVAQVTILFDLNKIASLVTMSYLMSFFSVNAACFLLRLTSAPNFRPSFHYFNSWTALLGALLSVASMFFVDGVSASGAVAVLVLLFVVIHYTTPPKSWGDVSSGLIYHQVRKYLLRLRTEHVKFWRPQILLFVNDPRRGYKLIQFCNSLKKGGLYILGHVIVTQNFGASVPEARRQQAAWTKYIDFSHIKAFINVAISPSIEWGARNIVLSAGLGGMRPNIVVLGFYNLQQFRSEQPLVDVPSPPPERKHDHSDSRRRRRSRSQGQGSLPTDICYVEKRTDVQSYVMVLEDMILKLQINLAIATGFSELELPNPKEGNSRKYIDLWPIQMSAEISSDNNGKQQNLLTTNFDTYTLILQLGCILGTVPSWKKSYKLRVAVFVEFESDVDEERARVTSLLESLRIEASVLVFWLACGSIKSYEIVVNGQNDGDEDVNAQIDKVLEDEQWWGELQQARGKIQEGAISAVDVLAMAEDVQWPSSSFQSRRETSVVRFEGLRKILKHPRRRSSFGNISNLGVSLNMRTHRLDDDLLSRHVSHPSDSEFSPSETESEEEHDSESESEAEQMFLDEEEDKPENSRDLAAHSGTTSPEQAKAKSLSSKKSSRASSKKSKSSRKPHPQEPHSPDEVLVTFGVRDDSEGDEEERRGRSRGPDASLTETDPFDALSPGTALPQNLNSLRTPSFKSGLMPPTRMASDEGAGPSIMFADEPHPRLQDEPLETPEARGGGVRSIYQRGNESSSRSRSPSSRTTPNLAAASIPLSFNDLPCRAQHLILNELMSQNSDDTAVIFTTLPAPTEGTYKSEADSLSYVSDLEVLCGGLPPTLLVHSNSMTVTMNL